MELGGSHAQRVVVTDGFSTPDERWSKQMRNKSNLVGRVGSDLFVSGVFSFVFIRGRKVFLFLFATAWGQFASSHHA
jgi:hypothetical protein